MCFEKLQVFFPLLFYIGYVAHCCDLLIKDLIKITEIAEIVDEARELSKFVKAHNRISHINKLSLTALSHRTHTLVETNNIQIKTYNIQIKNNFLTLKSFPGD